MKIGDRIAYSVQFLSAIGMSHSDMARARGTVVDVKKLSTDCHIAEIEWDSGDEMLPSQVNTANLAKVGLNSKFSKC